MAAGLARAREAVARALALEPELAEAHAQMGLIHLFHDWDWRAAEVSLGRALELAPGNAMVLRRLSLLAATFGRLDEAIGLCRRAIAQDPLESSTYNMLGLVLAGADRLAEAEQAHRKTLELTPERAYTHSNLGRLLVAQGRGDEALGEALREPQQWARLEALAIIYHTAGRLAEADAALQELIAKHAERCAFNIAEVYAARRETDLAFKWLDRAYSQRDAGLSELKCHRAFRPLHGDPRWGAFLQRVGLAD
jgi:Flp pilus assembly protein TadD